jgi:photosystem II stability/assembly factor-like uncharacterized protein
MVWAVGSRSTLLRSLNGGVSYTLRPPPAPAAAATTTLNGVHFTDRERGWVVGNDKAVWRTVDGGSSWTAVVLPDRSTAHLTAVLMEPAMAAGWIAASDGGIYASRDNGDTWLNEVLFAFPGLSTAE